VKSRMERLLSSIGSWRKNCSGNSTFISCLCLRSCTFSSKFSLCITKESLLTKTSSSIDKSNLGNAKTDGLTVDLHFKGNQYNILLSIFYVPLVLTAVPMNMLTKKFGAKFILPIAMMMFGSMAMISAATVNFGGIVTTRWFLGMAESGFYPGVIFYLTTFYKRNELAGRLSIFYAASEVAGAFTGLIAFGVFQIKSHLHGWQYLFLIEGMTSFISFKSHTDNLQ
jgi:MFS family permease